MNTWVTDFLSQYAGMYFVMQVFVITAIFVLGVAVTTLLLPKEDSSHALIFTMAFPIGISVFIFVGFIMLLAGVPYKTNLISLFLIVIGLCSLCCAAAHHSFAAAGISVKRFVISIILVVFFGALCTSGYLPMSVSNDSLYYFWQYPRAIVYYEGLRDQFDNFLTDTGVGAAVIGTIPFLYGFGETFGIQAFFNFNFILFFANGVYETLSRFFGREEFKRNVLVSCLAGVLIGVCTPAYILSHWAMANMYFMEIFFVIMYLLFAHSGNHSYGKMTLIGTLTFALALLRMEGAVFVLFIAVVASLLDYRGKDIAAFIVLPTATLVGMYDLKIFNAFNVDNPVKFLTPGKAVIQFAAFVILAVYLLFVRTRIRDRFGKWLPLLFIGALVLANVIICIMDTELYIANLRAFFGNLFGQSGWGILPYVAIGAMLIILVWEVFLSNRKMSRFNDFLKVDKFASSFWLMATVGFILICLVVSFARGDNLTVATGDSGNRVLLQGAPLIVFMIISWFIELIAEENRETEPTGENVQSNL